MGKNEVATSCALVVQVRSPKRKISLFNLKFQGQKKTEKQLNWRILERIRLPIRYPDDMHQYKCEAQNVLLLISGFLKRLVHRYLHTELQQDGHTRCSTMTPLIASMTLHKQWFINVDSSKVLSASFFSFLPVTQSILVTKSLWCPNIIFGSWYPHFWGCHKHQEAIQFWNWRKWLISCLLVSIMHKNHV